MGGPFEPSAGAGHMRTLLARMVHRLMGRSYLYQYFTNVTWETCPRCLSEHGRIAAHRSSFRTLEDGCPREILAFPVRELAWHKEMRQRMARVASLEEARRDLMEEATALLRTDPEAALERLEQAGRVDVYLPELERLAEEHGGFLRKNPELRARLRALLVERWREKFAFPRYERLPERMRMQHETWGVEKIREWFGP